MQEFIQSFKYKGFYLAFILRRDINTGAIYIEKYYEYIECRGDKSTFKANKRVIQDNKLGMILEGKINNFIRSKGWSYASRVN